MIQISVVNKKWWLTAIVVVCLFLAAGGAWAYYYYYWTAPDRVVSKSLISMGEIKTFHLSSEASTKLNLKGATKDQLSLLQLANTSGSADLSLKLDITAEKDRADQANNQVDGKLWLSLSTGARPVLLGLEFIQKDKISYLQLLDGPNLGFLDLSSLKNQWVKFSQKQLTDAILSSGQVPDYNKFQTISQEQIDKLEQIFTETKPIKFNQRYGSENINGIVCYHYGFIVEPKAMVDFVKQAGPVILGKTYDEKQMEKLKELEKELDSEQYSGYIPVTGEIWIGKSDYIARRLRVVISPQSNNSDKSDSLTMVMNWDRINEPVKIEAPVGALDLSQMLAGFMSGLSGQKTKK